MDSTFPHLIHAFQLTTINALHTIHIKVLVAEVVEKFLQQNKQIPNLVKHCRFSSYEIHNAPISCIWLIFWYFTVSKKSVNTILKDLFLILFRKLHALEVLLMNHPTMVTASQFLVKSNFL